MQAEPALQILASIIGVAIAAGLLLGVREWFWLRRQGQLNIESKCEMYLSLVQIVPNGFVSWLFAPLWFAIYASASDIAMWQWPFTWAFSLLALFAADFSYYWEHRCAHKVRLLWALYHGMHHTSSACTVATAYRVSFMNHFLAPAFYLPWVLLGLDPLLVLAMQMFVFHYQAWVHTEMIGELPWLDSWLNTPANHRMHHSSAVKHRDRNFGAVFMLWDHLFGTYISPASDLRYGMSDDVSSPQTVLQVFARPWQKR